MSTYSRGIHFGGRDRRRALGKPVHTMRRKLQFGALAVGHTNSPEVNRRP